MARQPRKIKVFLFRSWQRIAVLVILLIILIIITKHLPSATTALEADGKGPRGTNLKHAFTAPTTGENSHYLLPDEAVPHIDDTLQVIPEKFTGVDKCPACLGKDMCDEIKNGFVRISFPELPNIASQQGIYYGKWHEKQVVVRKVGVQDNRWQQFQKYICENITKTQTCDMSKVILTAFAEQSDAFAPDMIQNAYNIVHKDPADLQFASCASDPFVDAVKDATGLSEQWVPEKAAMLYTSMVISQEALLLKTAAMFTKPQPFPHMLGACGQLVVLNHQGLPLETYVSATWEKRSDLALQLLNIVDLFANGDVSWYIMYTDFRFENFDVTSDDRIVFMNLESMVIVDKESIGEYDDTTSDEPCNEPCFYTFLSELTAGAHSERRRLCARAPHVVTDAMYANLCKHVLSDLREHREADDEETDEGATTQPRGLLHSPPSQHRQEVTDLLLECVYEAVAGSRLQAVEDLSDILQQYGGERNPPDEERQ